MTRRNLLRSWLAATLMTASGAAGMLAVSPTPAGAASEVEVIVSEQGFAPSDVTVAPNTLIVFRLAADATTHHTITSDNFDLPFDKKQCYKGPRTLCVPIGRFGFTYYDRYAREAGIDHHGVIRVVASTPPSTQPPPPTTTSSTAPPTTTSSTAPPVPPTTRPPAPTTTTTQPATTSTQPPQTTTTAPSTVSPFLVDPAPTTAAPPVNPAGSGGTDSGATATTADKGKDKDKDKGKGEVDSPATPTTATPAPPEAPLIDPESLVPGPETLPEFSDPDDLNFDVAALTDLLSPEPTDEDGTTPLMLIVLAGGLVSLLAGGIWGWYHRASRYDPA